MVSYLIFFLPAIPLDIGNLITFLVPLATLDQSSYFYSSATKSVHLSQSKQDIVSSTIFSKASTSTREEVMWKAALIIFFNLKIS